MDAPGRLLIGAYAAQLAAAVTAGGLARKDPAHRPVAAGLVGLFMVSMTRAVLVYGVLRPARTASVTN